MGYEEAWKQFASEVGGDFMEARVRLGGFRLFGHPKVVVKANGWTVTLDRYGALGGTISGSFSGTLCRRQALANECREPLELTDVSGSFSATREVDDWTLGDALGGRG